MAVQDNRGKVIPLNGNQKTKCDGELCQISEHSTYYENSNACLENMLRGILPAQLTSVCPLTCRDHIDDYIITQLGYSTYALTNTPSASYVNCNGNVTQIPETPYGSYHIRLSKSCSIYINGVEEIWTDRLEISYPETTLQLHIPSYMLNWRDSIQLKPDVIEWPKIPNISQIIKTEFHPHKIVLNYTKMRIEHDLKVPIFHRVATSSMPFLTTIWQIALTLAVALLYLKNILGRTAATAIPMSGLINRARAFPVNPELCGIEMHTAALVWSSGYLLLGIPLIILICIGAYCFTRERSARNSAVRAHHNLSALTANRLLEEAHQAVELQERQLYPNIPRM